MEKMIEYNDGSELINNSHKKLNPWLSIWYAPRATIRSSINQKSMRLAIILAIITGMVEVIDRAIVEDLGEVLPLFTILLVSLVVGTLSGLFLWLFWSAISLGIGKLLGGKANYYEMRLAIGISFIPIAFSGILYCFDILFLGEALFQDTILSVFQYIWILFSGIMSIILAGWSIFLMIKAVAEAHQFSSWKGLLTLLIPVIILLILVVIIAVIFMIVQ